MSASISSGLSFPDGAVMQALNALAQFQSARDENRREHIAPHNSRPRTACIDGPVSVSGERTAAMMELEVMK